MREELDYLPVKFKYDYKREIVKVYYRVKNDFNLYSKDFPYEHYIYTRIEGNSGYKLLTDNIYYEKTYMKPRDAFALYRNSPYLTAEGDLTPEKRFIIDNYYDKEFPIDIKPRIFYLDIETYSKDNILPRFYHNIAIINAITVYDTYTKKYYSWFLFNEDQNMNKELVDEEIKKFYKEKDENFNIVTRYFNDAKSLLNSFRVWFAQNCPDIISAYNSRFDIPYIVRKIYDEFGEEGLKDLSPFGTISYKVKEAIEFGLQLEEDNIIPGISVIDYLGIYKANYPGEHPMWNLEYVSRFELGEGKVEYDSDDPIGLYEDDFVKFCIYNINDVALVRLIEAKKGYIDLTVAVRNISKCYYEDIFHESRILDYTILANIENRRANGEFIVLPSKPLNTVKEKYLGAYVKPTLVNRYKLVSDEDLSAQYPSTIITFNVSNETLVGVVENFADIHLWMFSNYIKSENIEEIIHTCMPAWEYQPSELKKPEKIKCNISKLYSIKYNKELSFNSFEDFKNWCFKNNYYFLGNGAIIDGSVKNALIPDIARIFTNKRKEYKKEMLKAKENHDKDLEGYFNISQLAVKRINNSIYGAEGNKDFRLSNKNIAEAITSNSQMVIKMSTRELNNFLNNKIGNKVMKDYVITNDTDSIIFTLQDIPEFRDYDGYSIDLEVFKKAESISLECQDHLNSKIAPFCNWMFFKPENTENLMNFKSEWVASSGLFVAKKSYAVRLVYQEGILDIERKVVGLTLKKGSTPKAMKEFLSKILDMILDFKDKKEIDAVILDEINKLSEVYDLEDIAIPSSVKDPDSYTTNTIQGRASKIYNKYFCKVPKDKIEGGKIKIFYVKHWKDIPELERANEYVLALPAKSQMWKSIKDHVEVDYVKMKERLIIKPLTGFYKALGWNLPKRLMMTKKKSLFSKILDSNKKEKGDSFE